MCVSQLRSTWDVHERMSTHHTALPASLCACIFILFNELPLHFRLFVLFSSEACCCSLTNANFNSPPCSSGMTIGLCMCEFVGWCCVL